jgi:hypothetical protein
MNQYIEDASTTEELYYLSCHAGFKSSDNTSHTHVALDGSCRSSNGLCLNEMLLVGPTIQQYLYSTFLRFRPHQFAFIADIADMYPKVKIHQSDRNLQRILR